MKKNAVLYSKSINNKIFNKFVIDVKKTPFILMTHHIFSLWLHVFTKIIIFTYRKKLKRLNSFYKNNR